MDFFQWDLTVVAEYPFYGLVDAVDVDKINFIFIHFTYAEVVQQEVVVHAVGISGVEHHSVTVEYNEFQHGQVFCGCNFGAAYRNQGVE